MIGKNGENSARDSSGRFGPGNAGKPRGARHRTTQAVLELLDGEAEALTRKAVECALKGDATAMKLCLERLAPPRKDAPVTFALPRMSSAKDAARAAAGVLKAVAEGELTPLEGTHVMGLIDAYRRTLKTTELEARLAAVENARGAPLA